MRDTNFLIVGGGIAGLRAAIALAPAGRVVVLTKAEPGESNTGYAQGGIAAAVGDNDSPGLHAADTIRAGDGLCDEQSVRVLVEQGPAYVRSEEHTSVLQSLAYLVCRLLLEKKKKKRTQTYLEHSRANKM